MSIDFYFSGLGSYSLLVSSPAVFSVESTCHDTCYLPKGLRYVN